MRLKTALGTSFAVWMVAALSGACAGNTEDDAQAAASALSSGGSIERDATAPPPIDGGGGGSGGSGGGGGAANCKGAVKGFGTVQCADSLFVTEKETLANFSFHALLTQIVATSGDSALTALGLYQQLLDTLNDAKTGVTGGPHCSSTLNGFPIECPRQEGLLASTDPFKQGSSELDAMFPVGVVNRFDLAPADGANCGQYRVVFAKQSGVTDPFNRFFLIFEAVLPNPGFVNDGKSHLASCAPVVDFWAGLSADTPAARAAALEDFYFTGLKGFAPVVQAANYGFGNGGGTNSGQIRANMFMFDQGGGGLGDGGVGEDDGGVLPPDPEGSGGTIGSGGGSAGAGGGKGAGGSGGSGGARDAGGVGGSGGSGGAPGGFGGQEWELREFRLSQTCSGKTCTVVANNVVVQANPFGELFGPSEALSAAFQKQFLKQIPDLATADVKGASNVVPRITMTTPDEFNAGESDEQDSSNDYSLQGSTKAFLTSITTELGKIKRTDLNAAQILNRATTQSCAGCHEVSIGADLGDGITWPSSNGFTQIDEFSNLSPALTGSFLPFRLQVMQDFASGKEVPADGSRTVGGQRTGSAN